MNGYNGVYFVYGQTGSGKTHTMGMLDKMSTDTEGIVPSTLKYIFEYFNRMSVSENSTACQFSVHLSFYQIYLDSIQDLLNPGKKNLVIREDGNEVYVENLVEVEVRSLDQALNILNAG